MSEKSKRIQSIIDRDNDDIWGLVYPVFKGKATRVAKYIALREVSEHIVKIVGDMNHLHHVKIPRLALVAHL